MAQEKIERRNFMKRAAMMMISVFAFASWGRAEEAKPVQELSAYLDQLQVKLEHTAQRANQPSAGGSSVVGLAVLTRTAFKTTVLERQNRHHFRDAGRSKNFPHRHRRSQGRQKKTTPPLHLKPLSRNTLKAASRATPKIR